MKKNNMDIQDLKKAADWITNNPDHELTRKLNGIQCDEDFMDRMKNIIDFVKEHGVGKVVEIDWSKNV